MRVSSATLGALLSSGVAADLYSIFTNPKNTWDSHTTIDAPNTAAFVNATIRWNPFSEPTYAAAISPATEADVAKAVALARANKVPLLGTGGRHAWSLTLSDLRDGLAIDLSKLNSVKVDAAAGTLTVGGGAKFADIYDPVFKAGYELPVGSCACPGVVGATIGGGAGRWQGLHGMIIDSLVSVRLVNAQGQVIDVSATSNPDLFWGIRGAGANFGIITSATYKLAKQINKGLMMSADIIIPASKNGSYFDILQGLQTMPAELGTITIMEYNATIGEFEQPQILANWVYMGPEDKGRALIAPLLKLSPTMVSVSMVPYNKLVSVALLGLGSSLCTTGAVGSWYGVNYRNLSSSTFQKVFQKMSDFYIEYPDGRGSAVEMEIFATQAVQKVANSATAYPWRDTKGYSLISAAWNSAKTQQAGDALMREIRSDYAATGGYDGLAVYASYTHGDETPQQLFGSALPRLTQLKKTWDPEGVFNFFHPIPTQ
ncbi:fad binding domain [Trichoderma arundinaceum]|uniref:Fad binding domain n=1 Tax=Trichoderma arundinaceum TaxID=490622 RepID=A0A395NRF8_TRIAR|nr:fad binding domain [Trichoderma arundinaceum]